MSTSADTTLRRRWESTMIPMRWRWRCTRWWHCGRGDDDIHRPELFHLLRAPSPSSLTRLPQPDWHPSKVPYRIHGTIPSVRYVAWLPTFHLSFHLHCTYSSTKCFRQFPQRIIVLNDGKVDSINPPWYSWMRRQQFHLSPPLPAHLLFYRSLFYHTEHTYMRVVPTCGNNKNKYLII